MQLMIYIHYWLLFFKNDNFKYTTASQRLTFNYLSLFHIFFISSFFLSYYIFSNSYPQRNITSVVYTAYHSESFCCVMYYIVSEICIGGHFLEDCFYCYSQQIKSAVANESLIPHNLMKKAPYFFWVENCYLLTWNLAHILSNLKTIKTFSMWRDWSHHISAFSAGKLSFTCFC